VFVAVTFDRFFALVGNFVRDGQFGNRPPALLLVVVVLLVVMNTGILSRLVRPLVEACYALARRVAG
jgi:hypothetical protein